MCTVPLFYIPSFILIVIVVCLSCVFIPFFFCIKKKKYLFLAISILLFFSPFLKPFPIFSSFFPHYAPWSNITFFFVCFVVADAQRLMDGTFFSFPLLTRSKLGTSLHLFFFFTWLIALFVLQIKCWCSECIFSWNRVEFFSSHIYFTFFFPFASSFVHVFFFFPDWGKCYDYFDWRPTLYTCTVSQ